jgi:hypothetical protein
MAKHPPKSTTMVATHPRKNNGKASAKLEEHKGGKASTETARAWQQSIRQRRSTAAKHSPGPMIHHVQLLADIATRR